MPNEEKNENIEFGSLNSESFVFDNFKQIPSNRIKYNGSFFHCWRVERLIKSIFCSKSWINSSSKSDYPPDFHNDKHHIMMEVMRIDDGVGGKRSPNSFERTGRFLKNIFGKDYKEKLNGSDFYFIPDTRNDNEYNFKAYLRNFERVLMNHSDKIDQYHKNYPKCKTCVLLICDESNSYLEKIENTKLVKTHMCFADKRFIDVIKECKANYVVWFVVHKNIYGNKVPLACIYDVKHLKQAGIEYNHDCMIKIK